MHKRETIGLALCFTLLFNIGLGANAETLENKIVEQAKVLGVVVEQKDSEQEKTESEESNLELEKGEKVLEEAKTLNNEIQEELEKLREERRLKKEREEQALKEVVSTASISYADVDVRTPSGLTGEQLEVALADTGLAGLGNAYAKAEREHNVNALVLIGISGIESGWGTSNFAKERNNLFGFQAYDSNVNAARHFESKEEAIMVVAKHLEEKYLTPTGPYYNGVTLRDINVKYASDQEWANKISSAIKRTVAKLEE